MPNVMYHCWFYLIFIFFYLINAEMKHKKWAPYPPDPEPDHSTFQSLCSWCGKSQMITSSNSLMGFVSCGLRLRWKIIKEIS